MPDGSRKRRYSKNKRKREWYAYHRAVRFARRFLDKRAFGGERAVNFLAASGSKLPTLSGLDWVVAGARFACFLSLAALSWLAEM